MIMVDELRKWAHANRPFLAGSCHLTADSVAELHTFAAAIGLRRAWFQAGRVPHYDLTRQRREVALAAGAVFVPAKEQVRRRRAQAAADARYLFGVLATVVTEDTLP